MADQALAVSGGGLADRGNGAGYCSWFLQHVRGRARQIGAAILLVSSLQGCSAMEMSESTRRYLEIIDTAQFSGSSRILNVTDKVCAWFSEENISKEVETAELSFRFIDDTNIDTWVITRKSITTFTKLLSINIDRRDGTCSAYVKKV